MSTTDLTKVEVEALKQQVKTGDYLSPDFLLEDPDPEGISLWDCWVPTWALPDNDE